MSFENTECPCGGKKATQTMLCSNCEQYFSNHPAMKWFNDTTAAFPARRNAAIILVTAARQRKQQMWLKPARKEASV